MRILVLQPVIPTYRKRVFEILSASSDPIFTIVAGNRAVGLRTLQGNELQKIRHYLVEPRNIQFFSRDSLAWYPEAWRLVRDKKPDCVIITGNVYDLTSWLVLLWGRWCNIPVLAWTHGLKKPEFGPKWWFRRAFYNLARGLFLYGNYAKKLLIEGGLSVDRIHVIYNSLDILLQQAAEAKVYEEDVQQLRKELEIATNASVLIFIGRILSRRGLSITLKAISIFKAQGRDIHLLFIGDGDDTNNLRDLSIRLGIGNKAHFIGAIHDEVEIAKYMKLSAAAVILGGLPIIHPMGYGVPPIISDNLADHGPEWEAVEEGKTGYFFRDNDLNSLVSTINRCFEDETKRLLISKNARKRAIERYSSEHHAMRIIEGIYRFTDLDRNMVKNTD